MISRDAVFHEDTFPFHSIIPHSELTDPFSHISLPISPSDSFLDSSQHQPHASHSIESSPATSIGQSPLILSIPSQFTHSISHSSSQPVSPSQPISPAPPALIVSLRWSTRPIKTPSYL